jgi:hypothetical protein
VARRRSHTGGQAVAPAGQTYDVSTLLGYMGMLPRDPLLMFGDAGHSDGKYTS